jgi:O-antigen ligase
VLAAGGVLFLLRTLILTGTRSVLISLFFVGLIWFIRSKMMSRVLGLAGIAAATVLILVTTPTSILERLSTTLEAFTTTHERIVVDDEAARSAAERRELLKDGIWTTITHPIWGIGPGQFGQYRWSSLSLPGIRKSWYKTHNTYVELSANSGLPGVGLYMYFMYCIYRIISRIRKAAAASPTAPQAKLTLQMALSLEMAFIFFAVTAMFMTVEAHPYIFILGAFALAMERLVASIPVAVPAPAAVPVGSAFRQPFAAPSAIGIK